MPLFADLLRFPLVGPEKLMMREFFAFPDYFLAETNQLFSKVNDFLTLVLFCLVSLFMSIYTDRLLRFRY